MFGIVPFRTRSMAPTFPSRTLRDFDDFFNRLFWAPDMSGVGFRNIRDFDLYEKDGNLHLSIEAPGAEPEDFEVRIAKDSVSIKCKKESAEETGNDEEKGDEGKTWYSRKSVCSFDYEVALPFEIDNDRAEAVFENGLIKIIAPRMQASESKVVPLKRA